MFLLILHMIYCKLSTTPQINKKLILTSYKMLITTKTHTEVSMSYKHLTLNDRNKIEVSNKEGYSSRRISKVLGFHHSTIASELKRCKSEYKSKSTKEYKRFPHINRMLNTLKRQFNLISVLGKRLYWKQDFDVKERRSN